MEFHEQWQYIGQVYALNFAVVESFELKFVHIPGDEMSCEYNYNINLFE